MHLLEILNPTKAETQQWNQKFWFPCDGPDIIWRQNGEVLISCVMRVQWRQRRDADLSFYLSWTLWVSIELQVVRLLSAFLGVMLLFSMLLFKWQNPKERNKQLTLNELHRMFVVLESYFKHFQVWLIPYAELAHATSFKAALLHSRSLQLSHTARINCRATMRCTHWTQTARPHSQPCLHRVGKAALFCAIPLHRLKPAWVTVQVSGGSFKVWDFERKNENRRSLKGLKSTYCVNRKKKTFAPYNVP